MSIKLIGLKPQSNFRELSDKCIFQDYTYILASRYSIWNAICFAKCDTILVKSSLFLSNFLSEPKQVHILHQLWGWSWPGPSPASTCQQPCSSWWRSHTPRCKPPIQSPERANGDGFLVRFDAYNDLLIFLNGILDLLPYSIFWAFQILPDTLQVQANLDKID